MLRIYDVILGVVRDANGVIERQALGYVGAVDEGLLDRMRKVVGTLVRLVGK